MTELSDQAAVDRHIRNAVAAARRKGISLRMSTMAARLRTRMPGAIIDTSYMLDHLVREAAKRGGVAIEVDIHTRGNYLGSPFA